MKFPTRFPEVPHFLWSNSTPSARFLTASLLVAQDGSASQGDRGADPAFAP
jgi:hypothetical protein